MISDVQPCCIARMPGHVSLAGREAGDGFEIHGGIRPMDCGVA